MTDGSSSLKGGCSHLHTFPGLGALAWNWRPRCVWGSLPNSNLLGEGK